ncbi:MAG: hypothetical protein Q7S87_00370 [Agitococcus sp.]|nr:hypothetical protein [Agitococcus sp.]
MTDSNKTIFSIAFSMAFGFLAIPAQAIDINGDYKSDDDLLTLRIIALDAKEGNTINAAAQITTSNGNGCAGDVSGVGKVVGNVLKFNSYTTFASKCTLTIKFNKDGSVGNISEKSCLDWHGAQCGFDGRVSK